jgi:hypothetical protein
MSLVYSIDNTITEYTFPQSAIVSGEVRTGDIVDRIGRHYTSQAAIVRRGIQVRARRFRESSPVDGRIPLMQACGTVE